MQDYFCFYGVVMKNAFHKVFIPNQGKKDMTKLSMIKNKKKSCLDDLHLVYPKNLLFLILTKLISIAAKRMKVIKKEDSISEFRYVMD